MSDSFLLQVIRQDEPNENEMYLLQPEQTEAPSGVSLESPAGKEPPSVPQAEEDASGRDLGDHELFYKTSEDSLDQTSGQESPVRDKQLLSQGYPPDTDSCMSVSPSPDPDSKKKTFDFSMIDTEDNGSNLTAAIQMEQEFLDFMFSLPQIQKEAKAREQQQLKSDLTARPNKIEAKERTERPKAEKRSVGNASRAGLDHLDNLCRMMEQLGELKEQNTRLQRRVQYLEELKTLQEMHRDVQDSIAARKTALSLGSISLSDSDLRLENINKSCDYLLDSEESLDQSVSSVAKTKGKSRRKENLRARSHSVGIEEHCNILLPPTSPSEKNSNGNNNDNGNSYSKASRWNRVKGALKIERATGRESGAPPPLSSGKGLNWPSSSCRGETLPAVPTLSTTEMMEIPYSVVHPPSPSSSESSNLSQVLTEEDILNLYRMAIPADERQMLELPNSSIHLQPHSSSEEDRRLKDDPQRAPDKSKKGHKSAWGKVKHMISYNSKRESVRKKSGRGMGGSGKATPVLTKSFSVTSAKTCGQEMVSTAVAVEGIGISDPEEYDLEYESMDPDGTSWDWEGDCEGGIWMGPKNSSNTEPSERPIIYPCLLSMGDNFLTVPKNRPQLTITLPSSENLQHIPASQKRLSTEFKSSQGPSQPKSEVKSGPELSTTPPSPRRSSNWSKVKQAFLTGPASNQPPPPIPDHELASPQDRQLHSPQHFQPDLQGQGHIQQRSVRCSHPSTPLKRKKLVKSNFSFDTGAILGPEESDSPSGVSPEIIPDDLILQSHHRSSSKDHPQGTPGSSGRHGSLPSSAVHKNLIDLQKTLTGEFSKKLQEWERFRGHQGVYTGGMEGGRSADQPKGSLQHHSGENLPQEFRKKLHEWEKMKGREKVKHSRSGEATRIHGHSGPVSQHLLPLHHHHHHQQNIGQDDLKTKKHDEDDLPPDFKKKLTEWEIRKALVGKGQQNVEQLQKNLGEEFNKKMAEWEKMKALGGQGKINARGGPESALPQLPNGEATQSSALRSLQMSGGRRPADETGPAITLREQQQQQLQARTGARTSHLAAGTGVILPLNALDRKGSAHKVKKSKAMKTEKPPLAKLEGGQKNRDKELHWLEKELSKIEREKQRLEREKEKYLEREARLEKMRHAMRQGPAEKKEIYIKTSTGEFRFEGISQTFTKKLYEWEERRGIRPESSTFVLLDPNYKAPVKEEQNVSTHQSPETKRITRARSESSLAEISQSGTMSALISHQSSVSLNEKDKEDGLSIQADNKASSEPTFSQDELSDTSKYTVLAQIEELSQVETKPGQSKGEEEEAQGEAVPAKNEGRRSRNGSSTYEDPYAPSEITRLIDSSGSDETLNQRQQHIDEELAVVTTNGRVLVTQPTFETEANKLLETDSQMSEGNYRSLLHENMTLLGKLKEQENLCRALETQMGDIDSKMDNVADQHLKTLEKLHRQVTIMKKSESFSRMSKGKINGDSSDEVDEAESNQRLIEQLKARIVELELKGDKLMAEKEELECAFKLHKDHETQIAESLLIRIRELQDAGAEVNIQTVQCQTDDSLVPEESHENSDETKLKRDEKSLPVEPSVSASATSTTPPKKKRRKRRDDYNKTSEDEAYDEDKEESDYEADMRRSDKEGKEQQKRKKKVPPKKVVQKLHNLTADLLFQAKRLEGALGAKHHLSREDRKRSETSPSKLLTKRSLRGRSSLRLSKDDTKGGAQRKPTKGYGPSRTWSSIEAIVSPEEAGKTDDSSIWETRTAALASESQDLLAMNAELSRMARELRKEMMSVWSFRESTSPESNSSDGREETIKTKIVLGDLSACEGQEMGTDASIKAEKEDHWLDEEAREVFDSIASLQPLDSEDSKNAVSGCTDISDSDVRYKTSLPTVISDGESSPNRLYDKSLKEFYPDYVSQPVIESEEHFLSWWDVPFPKKRKESLQPNRKDESEETRVEETYADGPETPDSMDFEVVIPGSSGTRLGDLLHKTKDEPANEEFSEENETLCSLRLSPYYNITCPRTSRISRASSTTSEEDRKERKDSLALENDCDESAFETLRTNASSTFKSDILSSSFEYEDADKSNNCARPSPQILDSSWLDNSELSYSPSKKSEFTPSQLHKVGKIIEEAVLTIEEDKRRGGYRQATKQRESSNHECNLEHSKYETEVKAGNKTPQEDGGLRTRRVSDTQVEYEAQLQRNYNFPQCLGNSDHIYASKSSRAVTRIPSVRRNQSESDVSWLYDKQHQSSQHLNDETSSDVFVTTHRTIFTISGEENLMPTRVIPTFFQNNDTDEQSLRHVNAYDHDFCENWQGESPLSNVDSLSFYQPQQRRNCNMDLASDLSRQFPVDEKQMDEKGNVNSGEAPVDSNSVGQNSAPIGSPSRPPTFLDALSSSYHVSSQPFESKKKVLEASSETSPIVKNMIDLYNKRITEKQELLINPFKPGDPFKEKKSSKAPTEAEVLNFVNKDNKSGCSSKNDSKNKILKSQSTSIIHNSSKISNLYIQKSPTTGICNQSEILEPASAPVRFSGAIPIPMTLTEHSNSSFPSSKSDIPFDLDVSTEESTEAGSESRGSFPQPPSQSGIVEKSRAVKLRKAKEEFLARGATPMSTRKRLSGEFEYHSKVSDLSQSVKGASVPSSPSPPISSSADSTTSSDACVHKGAEAKQLSVKHKESFRRQSESGIRNEGDVRKNVIKSASSGLIELRKKHSEGLPPSNKENRKSCFDASDSKRKSKGIFKLFKLSKGKDRKDLGAVQKLCRQSLAVDLSSNNQAEPIFPSRGDEQQPSTSSRPPSVGPTSISANGSRCSRTLPREAQTESSASSSRSCPSSPVGLRKSRTAQWLAKGKNIFKSRSPSPNKRPR